MKTKKFNLMPMHFFVLISAFLLALFYVFYTGHIWEDFFITFRHSQNFANGNGLVYNAGEKVYGFTSPIGVLLPALFYFLTAKSSYLPALWLFRIISILLYASGCILIIKSVQEDKYTPHLASYIVGIFYLLDVKAIAYSTNGMETAFMLFFLAWSLFLLQGDLSRNWLAAGIAWAGLVWTRPDGVIYIIILAIGSLLNRQISLKRHLLTLIKIAAVCAIIYLPWFIWTGSYYGSPLPHTVVAKGFPTAYDGLIPPSTFPKRFLSIYYSRATAVFLPIYYSLGGWPKYLEAIANFIAVFSIFYWVFPTQDRYGRIASLSFTLLCVYLAIVPYNFPWYYPPAALFAWVALACGIFTLTKYIRGKLGNRFANTSIFIFLLVICIPMVYVWIGTVRQMRVEQREIEEGVRIQIGKWLKAQVKADENVFLEPLGYIGYFSGVKILDSPGLVSLEVTRLRKEKRLDYFGIIREIRPDWVILRPSWRKREILQHSFFRNDYVLTKTFDVRDRLKRYRFINGIGYLMFNANFEIYKKREI